MLGPVGETYLAPAQPPQPLGSSYFFSGGPARAYMLLPSPSPQGGWPGLGSHSPGWICGCFEGQGLEPEEKVTIIHSPFPSPQDSPTPSWLPGAAPTERRRHVGCRSRASRIGPPTSPTAGRQVVRPPSPPRGRAGKVLLAPEPHDIAPRSWEGQVRAMGCLGARPGAAVDGVKVSY